MREKILIFGSGGHAKSIIDTLKSDNKYEIVGLIDTSDKVGSICEGYKILGTDEALKYYYSKGIKYAIIGVGSTGIPLCRLRLYDMLKREGYKLPIIIDSTAIISSNTDIGEGTFIGKGVIINTGTMIGKNCIINTGSIIEHDCSIQDHVHIAPGTVLSGGVCVETMTHIGASTTVIQGLRIGQKTIIGAGSVVTRDMKSGIKAYGCPCKEVSKSEK